MWKILLLGAGLTLLLVLLFITSTLSGSKSIPNLIAPIDLSGRATPTTSLTPNIPNPSEAATKGSAPSFTPQTWSEMMLKNSPSYEKGSFSGILTAGKNGEIWIIGKKISSKIYPGTYIGVKNTSGEYFAKISPIIRYTAQKGDDLINSKPDYIEAKGILTGDDVAMRTTFADNLALALEIRKLTREPAPD